MVPAVVAVAVSASLIPTWRAGSSSAPHPMRRAGTTTWRPTLADRGQGNDDAVSVFVGRPGQPAASSTNGPSSPHRATRHGGPPSRGPPQRSLNGRRSIPIKHNNSGPRRPVRGHGPVPYGRPVGAVRPVPGPVCRRNIPRGRTMRRQQHRRLLLRKGRFSAHQP